MKKFLAVFAVLLMLLCATVVSAAEQLTVFNDTDTKTSVPLYMNGSNYSTTKSQHIIPAEYLQDMAGSNITSLTYYISHGTCSGATWEGYLFEVNESSFASPPEFYSPPNGAEPNYTGTVSYKDGEMTIALEKPYPYKGGNLLISFGVAGTGNNQSVYFYGSAQSENTACYGSGGASCTKFLPKTTFTYEEIPVTVTASANNAAYGTVSGSGAYDNGGAVTLTAAPADGYYFAYWKENGGNVSTDAEYTFTATADRNLTAVFVPVGYTLEEKTLFDGTDTRDLEPLYMYAAGYSTTKSQHIIPKEYLQDMAGSNITSLTYYICQGSCSEATWEGYLFEVNESSFGSQPEFYSPPDGAEPNYTGTVSYKDGEMTIALEKPYPYKGGNLLISFGVAETGNNQSLFFYGSAQSENTACCCGLSGAANGDNFLPKTTFTYEKADEPTKPEGEKRTEQKPDILIPYTNVRISDVEGCSVKLSVAKPVVGRAVIVTVTADEGRTLESVLFTDASGREVKAIPKGEGRYLVIMPASGLRITPVMAEAEAEA